MDPIERLHDLLTRLEDPAALSDEEIADTESELREVYAGLREADRADDDEALAWITEGLDLLDTESQARAEAAAERAQRLAELDARVEGQESDEEGAEAPAPVVGESEGDAPKTAPKAAPEKAPEAEKVEAPKAENETPAPRASEEHPAEEARAAAASSAPRAGRASLAQIGQRAGSRPGGQPRERHGERNGARMFVAAHVPGLPMGTEITTRETLGNALQDQHLSFMGASARAEKVPVVRITQDYPAERQLSSKRSAEANTDTLDHILRPMSEARGASEFDALTAAGGVCGLGTNLYDIPTLSSRGRPVRDALATVNADRGTVRFLTPAQLSDIGVAAVGTGTGGTTSAVAQVTNAQDVADYLKPHQVIDCGDEVSVTIYAVTNYLEAGVLQTRTSPETVAQWLELAAAAHDRFAEQLLLAAITTGSTLVTEQQDLGVARDFLNYVNRAGTAIRNRHRMDPNAMLRVIAPHWIVTAIQNDLWSAAFPGEGQSIDVTEAQIVAAARARNVNLSFTIDSQVFSTQGAGKLTDFFTVADWWVFPEGTWAFLDGGTLDLGLFRDSSLVDANKVRIFSETFENVAKRGVTSYRVRQTFCANGASAGTVDPNGLCDGGS